MYVFHDKITFLALQMLIMLMYLWCNTSKIRYNIKSYFNGGSKYFIGGHVTRSDKSKSMVYALYAACAAIVLAIDSVASSIEGYRVFWMILHITIMIHLFFFNSLFRNWIIGFSIKADQFKEEF